MVLGSAYQPPQSRSMDVTSHVTTWIPYDKKKTTGETREAMESSVMFDIVMETTGYVSGYRMLSHEVHINDLDELVRWRQHV